MASDKKSNKNNLNDTSIVSPEKKSNFFNTKTSEIIEAFKKFKTDTNASYFDSNNKKNLIADFRAYVKTYYGEGMLTTLQKEGKLDQAFNEISER